MAAVDLAQLLAYYQRKADAGSGEYAAAAVLLHTVVHGPWQDRAGKFAAAVDPEDGVIDMYELTKKVWSSQEQVLVDSAASLFRGSVDTSLTVNLGEAMWLDDAEYAVWRAMLQAARTRTIPAGYR